MAHFAKIENNIVTQVIVAEQDFIDYINSYDNDLKGEWIQTSYNTFGNKHLYGGEPLRGNFAGVGCEYNREYDIFIPIKQFDSWILDINKATYIPPIQKPEYPCYWNEEIKDWEKIIIE